LKILQVNGRSDLSGGPIAMLRLLQKMNSSKFSHTVFCPSEPNGIISDIEKCPNCTVISSKLIPFNFLSLIKMVRFLKKEKFDLIHSHGKAAGVYSRIVGKITGVPVIHQLHGIHYKQYPKIIQFLYLSLESFFSHWSKTIICVSESERDEGLKLRLFNKKESVVINNSVDTTKFKPSMESKAKTREKNGIPLEAKVILSISRVCYQKNPELTLDIFAKIYKNNPNSYLMLIGISKDDYKIQKQAESLGIQNNLLCLENQKNIHQLLSLADVYISTSRWEGLSLGVIEAMAMEIPVILSEVTGNEELKRKDNNEVLFISSNLVSDYVQAIEHLFQNESYASQMGQLAREKVKNEYNLLNSTKKMEKVYLTFDPKNK
jgi:glycosyltransferase involved in cell wall biosynthesis